MQRYMTAHKVTWCHSAETRTHGVCETRWWTWELDTDLSPL